VSGELSLSVRSPSAMRRLGACLGQLLQPGDFVGLAGDLGAGKTVLARGIAEGAQVPAERVASPTFAIVYPYQGRILIHHADLYRLSDEDELEATGYFDLLKQAAATVVEWIDKVPGAVPPEHLRVTIERTGDRGRRVRLEPVGDRHQALAQALVEAFRRK
jgi:tRNA threonylcarbamoyladenosine biosynthesis protein TsaE